MTAPAGPFTRPAPRRVLAALVVLAIMATAWVGLARRRDDAPPRVGDTGPTLPAPEAATGTVGPPPDRGSVLPLIGDGDLPDGWTAVAGTWIADETGIHLAEAPAGGAAIATTTLPALPWATASLSGTVGRGWGVVFGVVSAAQHHVVAVEGGRARLLRVEASVETELASVEVPTDEEVVVSLDVIERNVAVHVGGAILGSVQVPTVEAAQQIGVRAAVGSDVDALRWTSIGVRPRPVMEDPLVARGQEVIEMTPEEARRHLGP